MPVALLIIIIFILLIAFSLFIRKMLNVDQRNWVLNDYVTPRHKKVDRIIRVIAVIFMIIGLIINLSRGFKNELWYLQAHNILWMVILVTELYKAFIEKRHAENPNAYKATLAEILFTSFIIVMMFYTNIFGLL